MPIPRLWEVTLGEVYDPNREERSDGLDLRRPCQEGPKEKAETEEKIVLGFIDQKIQELLKEHYPRQDVRVATHPGFPAFWSWEGDRHIPASLAELKRALGKDTLKYYKDLPVVHFARRMPGNKLVIMK